MGEILEPIMSRAKAEAWIKRVLAAHGENVGPFLETLVTTMLSQYGDYIDSTGVGDEHDKKDATHSHFCERLSGEGRPRIAHPPADVRSGDRRVELGHCTRIHNGGKQVFCSYRRSDARSPLVLFRPQT